MALESRHPGRPSHARLALAALAGLAAIWVAARWLWGGQIEPGLIARSAAPAPRLPLGEATRATVPIRHEVIGTIQSRFPVDAASRIAARVITVNVHAGERVRAGQTLVTLEAADLRAALAQAEGQLAAATGELARASADERRYAALYPRGSVTASERDTAVAADRAAAGHAQQARAAVAQARAALAYATVRAPAAGVVIQRMVERGDMTMPGRPLVRLYDASAMRVQLEIPEDLARRIAPGAPLTVTVDAIGATFSTRVSEIVPAADPRSRTFLVRAPLPAGPNLRPGMFARATFAAGVETIITAPRAAITRVGQLSTVRVYARGATVTRMVSLGRPLGDRIEVLAGLKPGERVLLENSATPALVGQANGAEVK